MKSYLIIDIGTGNVRVSLVGIDGKIISIERDNVVYHKDEKYKEALYFEPDFLWEQILILIRSILSKNKEVEIIAATASSQREGVVLLDKEGNSMIGFPNHDHRGRFMEDMIQDKGEVYQLTGRYPTSLFSALKLVAYREKYPDKWKETDCFLSISDWAQYQLTGIKCYEHAQASETILYDVENKRWSDRLLGIFNLDKNIVPPLYYSGTLLGAVKEQYVKKFGLNPDIPVFVGGADTQLAIKSTRPNPKDIVLVSGTTTPVVQITTDYVVDKKQRSWTNSHLNKGQYILETNCGVTGLNYQRVKSLFFPNDSYETVENEIDELSVSSAVACLGSLLADDNQVVTSGGFLFDVPIMTELSRADFAYATLWDIACSIKENFDCLIDIENQNCDYVWCCGGGFQSRHLRRYVAGLIQKKLYFRKGYEQASVSGAAVVCEQAMNLSVGLEDEIEVVHPDNYERYKEEYERWKTVRDGFKRQ